MYTPDKWVILKLKNDDQIIYKVMGGWQGGYLGNDSWRVNSGITKVEVDNDYYLFHGHSGSTYKCHKKMYGMTYLMSTVLPESDNIEIMEDQDFSKLLENKDESN